MLFIIVNLRKMWHTCVRKFLVTMTVLLVLYLLYQWFGQPIPKPQDAPTIVKYEVKYEAKYEVMCEQCDFPG